jgi:outer membrane protein OmpA-like peptidoglycan-associated protein
MNKKLLVVTIIASGLAASNVLAGPSAEARRDGVILGSTVAGAILGGPLGFLAGTISGAWLGGNIERAAMVPELEAELLTAQSEIVSGQMELSSMHQTLQRVEEQNVQYAQLVLQQLELEMLFTTGADKLNTRGSQRIDQLAAFLSNNPDVSIRLDGYADPRGGEAFNLNLSQSRIAHIRSLLIDNGIMSHRIVSAAHGKADSYAVEGDYDAYALERVVKIQLSQGGDSNSLATSD